MMTKSMKAAPRPGRNPPRKKLPALLLARDDIAHLRLARGGLLCARDGSPRREHHAGFPRCYVLLLSVMSVKTLEDHLALVQQVDSDAINQRAPFRTANTQRSWTQPSRAVCAR